MNGNVLNFKIEKLRMEGKTTPEVLRDSMDKWIDDYEKLEEMIVIYRYEDEEGAKILDVGHTMDFLQDTLGLIEWAKAVLIEACRIENEE